MNRTLIRTLNTALIRNIHHKNMLGCKVVPRTEAWFYEQSGVGNLDMLHHPTMNIWIGDQVKVIREAWSDKRLNNIVKLISVLLEGKCRVAGFVELSSKGTAGVTLTKTFCILAFPDDEEASWETDPAQWRLLTQWLRYTSEVSDKGDEILLFDPLFLEKA